MIKIYHKKFINKYMKNYNNYIRSIIKQKMSISQMKLLFLKYLILSKLINKKIKMMIANFNFNFQYHKFFLIRLKICTKEKNPSLNFIFLK